MSIDIVPKSSSIVPPKKRRLYYHDMFSTTIPNMQNPNPNPNTNNTFRDHFTNCVLPQLRHRAWQLCWHRHLARIPNPNTKHVMQYVAYHLLRVPKRHVNVIHQTSTTTTTMMQYQYILPCHVHVLLAKLGVDEWNIQIFYEHHPYHRPWQPLSYPKIFDGHVLFYHNVGHLFRGSIKHKNLVAAW